VCYTGHSHWYYSMKAPNLTPAGAQGRGGVQALIDGSGDDALASEPAVKAVALFDHEECGSSSAQGAMVTMTAVWGVCVQLCSAGSWCRRALAGVAKRQATDYCLAPQPDTVGSPCMNGRCC